MRCRMKKRIITLLLATSLLLCSCSKNVDSPDVLSDTSSEIVSSSEETEQSKAENSNTASATEATVSETVITSTTYKPEETSATEDSSVATSVPKPAETTIATPKPETTTSAAPKPETTKTTATSKPATTTETNKPATTSSATTTIKPVEIPEGAEMSELTHEQRYYVYGIDKEKQEAYYNKISNIKLPIIHISTENKQKIRYFNF